jgi:hypothetical protein
MSNNSCLIKLSATILDAFMFSIVISS